MSAYTEDVQRGAALLDEEVGPGWEAKINLETLDVMDPDNCVLGQVLGERAKADASGGTGYGYAFGFYPHETPFFTDGEVYYRVHSYGFCGSDPKLREEWVEHIKSRVPAAV